MEIELKLSLNPSDNERMQAHPLLAGQTPGRKHTVAHYVDTPELLLMRHGAGLRVRRSGEAWTQTMKAGGSVQSGLHSRNEWETPVSGARPQLGRLRKQMDDAPEWQALLAKSALKDQLQTLFTVEVERSRWELAFEGSRIELVLDVGHIICGEAREPVNEIELELLEGEPASLFHAALQLLDTLPLHLSNASKAERGYGMLLQQLPAPHHADPVQLDPEASTGEALLAIAHNCLAQVQHNEAAVLAGEGEGVHQMRVGLRRLRSALKLFDAVAPCPPELQEELSWLGQELGAARDWDVLGTSTLAQVPAAGASDGALPGESAKAGQAAATPRGKAQGGARVASGAPRDDGQAGLSALVRAEADQRRTQAAAALRSPRYTRLQLTLALWLLELESARAAAPLSEPAIAYAQEALDQLHRRLFKRARRARHGDEQDVHRLRIAAKRARYALEFFQPLYRAKAARRYLKTLAGLQDALGLHNDLAVAGGLLRELAQRQPQAAADIGYARGYLARHQADGARIRRAHRQLSSLKLPRPA
ncbi:CHAD domain-containing protein [Oxalobacteraceae bacterium A2-2]